MVRGFVKPDTTTYNLTMEQDLNCNGIDFKDEPEIDPPDVATTIRTTCTGTFRFECDPTDSYDDDGDLFSQGTITIPSGTRR